MDEPGLGRRVGSQVADRPQADDRRDVDDPARPLRGDERARRRLGDEPRAAQVRVHDGVPAGLVEVERRLHDADARVVDDDVDRPDGAFANAAAIEAPSVTSMSTAIARPPVPDLADERLEEVATPRRDDDGGARVRERLREVAAEAGETPR